MTPFLLVMQYNKIQTTSSPQMLRNKSPQFTTTQFIIFKASVASSLTKRSHITVGVKSTAFAKHMYIPVNFYISTFFSWHCNGYGAINYCLLKRWSNSLASLTVIFIFCSHFFFVILFYSLNAVLCISLSRFSA